MKKSQWFTMVAVVVACTFLFSGMLSAASPMKVRISLCNAPSHPQSIGMQVFKKYVEEKTKGGVQVGLYYNSQLGGERESVEQVKNGSLEMATASAGPLTTFNKKFMVLDIPFAFDSYESPGPCSTAPWARSCLTPAKTSTSKAWPIWKTAFVM